MRKKIYVYFQITFGLFLIALSFDLIISPLKIVVGGVNGIAIIFNTLFNINNSIFISIFLFSMIILNLIIYGISETKKLVYCSIAYPILISFLESIPNIVVLDYSNKFMLFIFAGVLNGIGSGLIFKNGFLSGGTDVIKKILSDKFKIPMATTVFILDALIVSIGGLIFGLKSVLYAIIILYISSVIIDKIILGISNQKMFYIMTSNPEKVKKVILKEFKTGCTEIDALGGYTKEKHHVLMTVIPTINYIKLKNKISDIDSKAFFIITDSYYTYKFDKR